MQDRGGLTQAERPMCLFRTGLDAQDARPPFGNARLRVVPGTQNLSNEEMDAAIRSLPVRPPDTPVCAFDRLMGGWVQVAGEEEGAGPPDHPDTPGAHQDEPGPNVRQPPQTPGRRHQQANSGSAMLLAFA